jgi:hypothetical protein
MEANRQTYAQAFQEAVPICFSFLVSEYGFSLTKKADWLFEADSQYAYIDIFLDRRQVFVTMKPITPEDLRLPEYLRRTGQPDVAVIVSCLNPHEHPEFKRMLNPEEIHDELKRYAHLLRQYCTPLLRGDLSDWSKVEACLKERGARIKAYFEGGRHDEPPPP